MSVSAVEWRRHSDGASSYDPPRGRWPAIPERKTHAIGFGIDDVDRADTRRDRLSTGYNAVIYEKMSRAALMGSRTFPEPRYSPYLIVTFYSAAVFAVIGFALLCIGLLWDVWGISFVGSAILMSGVVVCAVTLLRGQNAQVNRHR